MQPTGQSLPGKQPIFIVSNSRTVECFCSVINCEGNYLIHERIILIHDVTTARTTQILSLLARFLSSSHVRLVIICSKTSNPCSASFFSDRDVLSMASGFFSNAIKNDWHHICPHISISTTAILLHKVHVLGRCSSCLLIPFYLLHC